MRCELPSAAAATAVAAAALVAAWWGVLVPDDGGSSNNNIGGDDNDDPAAADWLTPDADAGALRRCDLATASWRATDRVGDGTRPFRVTLDGAPKSEWFHPSRWHRAALLRRDGNAVVAAREVSSALRAQFGHARLPLPRALGSGADAAEPARTAVTLRGFADEMRREQSGATGKRRVVFDVVGADEATRRMRDRWARWPDWLGPATAPARELLGKARPALSIGPNGTGLAFHAHGTAWLATLKGTKLWFLVDPARWPLDRAGVGGIGGSGGGGNRSLELEPMSVALAESLLGSRADGLFVCAVGPGEAVYVPQGWHHATLNLGETVSVGTQLGVYYGGTSAPEGGPSSVATALVASWRGERSFSRGRSAEALSYLRRATELEPLNFKHWSNLVSALLSHRRFEEAVTAAVTASQRALQSALADDAVYAVSFFALRFFEAAALESAEGEGGGGGVVAANLVDLAKRLLDAAGEVGELDAGVRKLRDMVK